MGKTILLSSHILTELSDVCNAVAIMEKGSIVASGTIESIKEKLQPARSFTLSVLDRVAEARAVLEGSGAVSGLKDEDHTIQFQLEGDLAGLAALVKALAARDIPVVGLQERKQDLEGLFMQLTKGEVT